MTRTLVAALSLAIAAPLAAQQEPPRPPLMAPTAQHPLVGTWTISFAIGTGVRNGVAEPLMGTGTLVVSSKGDSLLGQLTTNLPAGVRLPEGVTPPKRPPTALAGKLAEGEVTLTSRTMATRMSTDGAPEQFPTVGTWKLLARGDSLTGTLQTVVEGSREATRAPAPVTGTRKTG